MCMRFGYTLQITVCHFRLFLGPSEFNLFFMFLQNVSSILSFDAPDRAQCFQSSYDFFVRNVSYEPRCGFPTSSDTNGAVQPQKMARGLKPRI